MMKGKIKVLWLCKGLDLGGCEKNFTRVQPYLDKSEFDFEAAYFLPSQNALVPELERANIPVFCLGQYGPYDPRGFFRLVSLLMERRPDVLHMHLPYSAIFGRPAAKLARVPATVYTEYNLFGRYHRLTSLANRLTYTWTDAVTCVADVIYDSLLPSFHGNGKPILRTINKGVDWQEIAAGPHDTEEVRREFSIQPEEDLVVNVGSFTPRKRQCDLLQAAKIVLEKRPKTKFILVGGGPLQASMEQLADELGISGSVTFTGWRSDAIRIMSASDLFVQSSLYEAMTVVLLEALALNLPIIATRIGGGNAEILADGVDGFLVERCNPTSLAETIVSVLESPELRRKVSQNSHERFAKQFDIKTMVQQTEAVYHEVLQERGR